MRWSVLTVHASLLELLRRDPHGADDKHRLVIPGVRELRATAVPQPSVRGSVWDGERDPMSPDHPLAPLIREFCPKRYPVGWPKIAAVPALDPVEIYELACHIGTRIGIGHTDVLPSPPRSEPQ